MSRMPIVVILGRPNVGKSTLVNRIVRRKAAVTNKEAGVTRDRRQFDAEWAGHEFHVVDTGGWEARPEKHLASDIREQAEVAVSGADLVVFVADATTEVTEDDIGIARILQRSGVPYLLAANKVDSPSVESDLTHLWGPLRGAIPGSSLTSSSMPFLRISMEIETPTRSQPSRSSAGRTLESPRYSTGSRARSEFSSRTFLGRRGIRSTRSLTSMASSSRSSTPLVSNAQPRSRTTPTTTPYCGPTTSYGRPTSSSSSSMGSGAQPIKNSALRRRSERQEPVSSSFSTSGTISPRTRGSRPRTRWQIGSRSWTGHRFSGCLP